MSDTITVTGNIATEPELKRTPSGVPITSFRIASSQRRYDKATDTWVDGATNWYTVSTFRGLAEHAYESLRKGHRVILTGRLKLREWETPVKKGISAEIDADAIGHDLLWGTTSFRRDERMVRSQPALPGSAPDGTGSGDEWAVAVPGGADATAATGEWAVPLEDADRLALVSAGADAEPPF
ncbi:single-stranded DNA-binding protein [Microbacterium sp. Root61]|uniref:single-stranded DNA-binding protein n=1 Tax=Microbacterium sp. Root61 TaxID=1736570 RepID=UPI0009EC11B0|nr:single-stranded DNA-binding protein [Microbacterium sp. Root61]